MTWGFLPRRAARHAAAKAAAAVTLSLAIPGPYFLLQYFPMRPVHELTPGALDTWVPFLPASIWIYQSLYPLLLAAGIFTGRKQDLKRFVRAMLASSAAAFLIFLVFPTSVPRPQQSDGLYAFWTTLEKSSNAFPSLHAAFCAILLCMVPRVVHHRFVRAFAFLWIAAILVSTLTTRQHILVDLLAGGFTGGAAFLVLRSRRPEPRTVLLVSGSSLDPSGSVAGALLRLPGQLRAEKHRFFSLKVKAVIGEAIVYSRLWRRTRYPAFIAAYFKAESPPPSLTRVLLEELLAAEGLRVLHLTISEVHEKPFLRRRYLNRASAVFLSTTLLHDLSEVTPLARILKRPWNRLIAGGAMTGSLPADWQGLSEIDVAALGYGEALVPAIGAWIRSGFETLQAPAGGRTEKRRQSTFLHSGLPEGTSLDSLPAATWSRAVKRSPNRMVYYESVRGCPYRCGFCNYPFLFSDTRFRYRSAAAMYRDWQRYAQLPGVRIINCLDSLFTMPKKRLHEFCSLLIASPLPLRWICYARADDLDIETAQMMRAAGALQVHIGLESGDEGMLLNMNKQTTVESNAAALENCRRTGITSIATLVVGYPGETESTLSRTLDFLRKNPPDFHFLAAFSTRVAGVPVLSAENRSRFGLITERNLFTMSPYWKHNTMTCAEAGQHLRQMTRTLIEEKVSLDAAIYYNGILDYVPAHRGVLLQFQADAFEASVGRRLFNGMHAWIDRRLREDIHVLDARQSPGT